MPQIFGIFTVVNISIFQTFCIYLKDNEAKQLCNVLS